MSAEDRARWDAKHAAAERSPEEPPDPFFAHALERLPGGGRALDLAAGTGRHALALARAGFATSAWDVSPVGLAILARRAAAAGLAVETRAVDVLDGPWPPHAPFDLVVCVLFLDRGLVARLRELVAPGGHLVLATRTTEWPGDRPPARYRLAPGELARGVAGFETLLVREEGGSAGLLARRDA